MTSRPAQAHVSPARPGLRLGAVVAVMALTLLVHPFAGAALALGGAFLAHRQGERLLRNVLAGLAVAIVLFVLAGTGVSVKGTPGP